MFRLDLARISIVIPVYNEADSLGACLLAISRQRQRAFEVIVVDNNSTDETVAIAQSFNFVRLLREPRQGVVHARNRGFDAARGEIIGRIDADTILDADWTEQVQQIMADEAVGAVSGSISYHDLPWQQLTSSVELFFRQRIADGMANQVFLQGANMAIRKTAWSAVRSQLCSAKGLHEDFDLAVHLHEINAGVVFDRSLHASLSIRRFDGTFASFLPYAIQNPKTYAVHGRTAQRHMYPVIALVIVGYLPIKLLYRSYDPVAERFSLSKLFALPQNIRVNPATFID